MNLKLSSNKDNTYELKPYCGGASKLPKGKRRGTLNECVKKGQIRYYGTGQKVDKNKIDELKKTKKLTQKEINEIKKDLKRNKRIQKINEGKIKNLEKEIEEAPTEKAAESYKYDLEQLQNRLNKIKKREKELNNKLGYNENENKKKQNKNNNENKKLEFSNGEFNRKPKNLTNREFTTLKDNINKFRNIMKEYKGKALGKSTINRLNYSQKKIKELLTKTPEYKNVIDNINKYINNK